MGVLKNRVEGDHCNYIAVHVRRHHASVFLKLNSCVFIAHRTSRLQHVCMIRRLPGIMQQVFHQVTNH